VAQSTHFSVSLFIFLPLHKKREMSAVLYLMYRVGYCELTHSLSSSVVCHQRLLRCSNPSSEYICG
jgi:hypothetical protein